MTAIDAHQHFWNVDKLRYGWLSGQWEGLNRTHEPGELLPQLDGVGVSGTIVVQAANSLEETRYLLDLSATCEAIRGVVGWVPLVDLEACERALAEFRPRPGFCGIRHLIHDEPDPDWVIRPEVLEALALIAAASVPFDVVAVLPRHLEHVPTIADAVPGLRMVIDHLAKPPIRDSAWEPWSSLMKEAAAVPTVFAKISGLNTAADPARWSSEQLQPYVDRALELFGPQRLMVGSDWPVSTIAGDSYQRVWETTVSTLGALAEPDRVRALEGTAAEFYGIGVAGAWS